MSAGDRSSVPRRVELSEPDLGWASAYERERCAVESALAGLGLVRIEHIGSTAVSGIRAKPIIDIMVGVETYDLLDLIRGRLESLDYEYDGNALKEEPGRHVFRKGPGDPAHLRTHHLHLTLVGRAYWIRILAFRDYLRANPEVALEYERLKMDLAQKHANDGRAYTHEKGTFVRRVESAAMHVAKVGVPVPVRSAAQDLLVAWHPASRGAPNGTPHGSAALCVTHEGDVVFVSQDGVAWELPGGRPEGDETWRETMVREVWEEACVRVEEATLLGFSRGVCVRGPEEGLVLVRALWHARVAVEPWKPRHEIKHRSLVQPGIALAEIVTPNPFAPIQRRLFLEASRFHPPGWCPALESKSH